MSLSGQRFLPIFPSSGGRAVFAASALGALSLSCVAWSQQSGAQTAAPVPANAQALGAVPAQTGPVVYSGSVVDPDNAEIPGATLTLTPPSGKAYTVTSGSDGTYAFRGVPAGTYSLTITMPGFATIVKPAVKIGGPAQTFNVKMQIQDQQTVVNVTANQNTVSVDQDANASSTVLKGKDLDALSDDPDELSSELSALAGPSAGPNGGQIYIDGFTGGQLPPKSSIREIRINQNPFSAQYDKAGFGRVEIFTKPGTDKFHLFAQINGNEKAFNTGSPFTNNANQPGYHTIFSFGQFSGPISKSASFTVGGSYRQIQNNSIVNPPTVYGLASSPGTICDPGVQTGCTIFSTQGGNGFSFAQLVPQTRWDINPRVDLALSEKNTLTVRFQYEHNSLQNQGIGGLSLASTGYDSTSSEVTVQVSDSQIVSEKVINETRFEYQRDPSSETPFSLAPTIVVQGAFNGGGSSAGTSNDTQNHIEVQNYTSVALAKHFIRAGGRLRYTGETNTSTGGSNGTFSYASICDYVASSSACAGQSNVPAAPVLADFTETLIPHPTVSANSVDLGVYAEDDWKIKPTWTFSYGLRFETQNYIHDKADFAPRLSTAYGVGKKTVLRAGFGLFYDRFGLGNQLATIRNNGLNQQQYTLSSSNSSSSTISPACTPANPIGNNNSDPYGCTLVGSRLTEQQISGKLRAPYLIQENIGVDQQLFTNATASVNYQHIRGIHQFNSDVPNYATASTTEPLIYQYQSEGYFAQNQLIVNINVRNFHGGSFGGYYSLNFANSDTGGINSFASIPNHLSADYGRASFDVRNRLFLYGSFQLPHLLTISPFIASQSGSPYNITSGLDQFGDNQFNGRAVFVPAGTQGTGQQVVKTIAGCGTFATPGTAGNTTPVPINDCTGPAAVAVNVRVVKTWGFGPSTRPVAGQGGPGGGPGGSGDRHGGPGGGRGGPGGPGLANSGKKYNLGLGFQAQNLFNDANLSTPVGTLTSQSFGTSTSVAGGPYSNGSALRRFQFQATFNF